jgi:hypothetical protein
MAYRGFEPPPFQGGIPITNLTTTRGELPLAMSRCPCGAQSGLVSRANQELIAVPLLSRWPV